MLAPDTTNEYLKLNTLLVGNKISVVPLDFTVHLDGLWDAQTKYKEEGIENVQMFEYLPYVFPTKEEFKTTVEGDILSSPEGGHTFAFVIRLNKTNQVIGFITYLRINRFSRSCELGHLWLDPRFRRQNLLDEAVFLMTRHAFDVVGYIRVEWRCDTRNTASRKMAERNGFVFEGIHRDVWICRGEKVSLAWLSITEPDWEKAKVLQTAKFNC